MRKIIQQMLRGEQVTFCGSVQTELKTLAADKEKALASLQELFSESERKKFDEIIVGWDKANAIGLEDFYGAGFSCGILAGVETAGVFDKNDSVLYRVLCGDLTRESLRVSAERERAIQKNLKNETMITRLCGEKEERFNEFYDFFADIVVIKEDEYFLNGLRKGILLGVRCADFLARDSRPEFQ